MIFPNFLFQKGIKSKRLNTHHFITILLQYNLIVPMHIYGQFTILAYLKGEKKIKIKLQSHFFWTPSESHNYATIKDLTTYCYKML